MYPSGIISSVCGWFPPFPGFWLLIFTHLPNYSLYVFWHRTHWLFWILAQLGIVACCWLRMSWMPKLWLEMRTMRSRVTRRDFIKIYVNKNFRIVLKPLLYWILKVIRLHFIIYWIFSNSCSLPLPHAFSYPQTGPSPHLPIECTLNFLF